jgi:hypothetical protein
MMLHGMAYRAGGGFTWLSGHRFSACAAVTLDVPLHDWARKQFYYETTNQNTTNKSIAAYCDSYSEHHCHL